MLDKVCFTSLVTVVVLFFKDYYINRVIIPNMLLSGFFKAF